MKQYLQNKKTLLLQNKLILSQNMKNAIYILQLPILELKNWIMNEIEKNPLLEIIEKKAEITQQPENPDTEEIEFSENSYKYLSDSSIEYLYEHENKNKENTILLDRISKTKSLYEHLLFQARAIFKSESDLIISKNIIGNLNSKGFLDFLDTEIEELTKKIKVSKKKILDVLKIIQTFDPPGIAARNLQESLLIQLKQQKKQNTLCYKILKNHFKEVLQNKFYLLSKKLNISSQEIKKLIYKEIKTLNFIPSSKYNYTPSLPLIIDITIKYENARWIITINEDELPLFIIKENYFSFSKEILSSEDKKFIRLNILQGKWILKSLARRKKILIQIASFLVKKQRNYLLGLGNLTPLSYNDLAKELNLHVSTISRAANNKYVDCPLGILPLKAFFSSLKRF